MSMKVILANLNRGMQEGVGRYARFFTPMPPISLAYAASAFRQAQADVHVFDDAVEPEENLYKMISRMRPDVFGASCLTPSAAQIFRVVRKVRDIAPSVKVVLGNLHAHVFAEDIIRRRLADVVVHGEGDQTIPELVKAMGARDSLRSVKGISFCEDGRVIRTSERNLIRDLDSVAFPCWEIFPIEKYRLFSFAVIREPATLVLASRGCPYNCKFCSVLLMQRRRRCRSARNLVDEIEMLNERFGYRQVGITDAIFPLSKREGLDFCGEMLSRGLHRKVFWTSETRCDLVDLELLQAMREAGMRRIMFGFESGSEETLSTIGKPLVVEDMRRAVGWAKKAGIEVVAFFIIGLPEETQESVEKTISTACSLDIDYGKFNIFTPFPGSAFYDELRERGEIPETEDWERFNSYPSEKNPPVYLPPGLSLQQLVAYQRKALMKFYLRPQIVMKHLFLLKGGFGLAEMASALRIVVLRM